MINKALAWTSIVMLVLLMAVITIGFIGMLYTVAPAGWPPFVIACTIAAPLWWCSMWAIGNAVRWMYNDRDL